MLECKLVRGPSHRITNHNLGVVLYGRVPLERYMSAKDRRRGHQKRKHRGNEQKRANSIQGCHLVCVDMDKDEDEGEDTVFSLSK